MPEEERATTSPPPEALRAAALILECDGLFVAAGQSTDATKVITLRITGFHAAPATGSSAQVEQSQAVAASTQSTFVGSEIAKSDRPEPTAVKDIVSGGRALGSAEKFNEVMTPLHWWNLNRFG